MNFIAALRKVTESIKAWVEARVTHWDDLEGKPFGEETITVLAEQQTVNVVQHSMFGFASPIDVTGALRDNFGKSIQVVFDGVSYEGEVTDMDGASRYVGSVSLVNIPFCIAELDGDGSYLLATEGEHTIEVYAKNFTTLDAKYLPEALRFGESEKNILLGHKFEEEGFSELGVNDGDNPRVCAGNLLVTTFNPAKSYTVVIRGDRYEDLTPSEPYRNYYWWTVWGGYSYVAGCSGGGTGDQPIALVCEHFSEDFTSVATVKLEVDAVIYPNITIEEVQIYETELITIDEKYLPELLRFGERIVDIVPEQTMPASPGDRVEFVNPLVEGVEYVVAIDGVEEIAVAKSAYSGEYIYLGNLGINMPTTYTDEEFVVFYNSPGNFMVAGQSSNVEGEHTIAVYQHDVKTLDEKYLPSTIINVSEFSDADGNIVYSVDITPDELINSLKNNIAVTVQYNGYMYPLVSILYLDDYEVEVGFMFENPYEGYRSSIVLYGERGYGFGVDVMFEEMSSTDEFEEITSTEIQALFDNN